MTRGPLAFVCVVSLTMQAPLRCGASAAHGPSTTSEASLASDAAARLSHASNGAGRLPIVPRPRPLGELSLPPHTPPTPHPHPGSPSSQPHTSLNPTQPHPTPPHATAGTISRRDDGIRRTAPRVITSSNQPNGRFPIVPFPRPRPGKSRRTASKVISGAPDQLEAPLLSETPSTRPRGALLVPGGTIPSSHPMDSAHGTLEVEGVPIAPMRLASLLSDVLNAIIDGDDDDSTFWSDGLGAAVRYSIVDRVRERFHKQHADKEEDIVSHGYMQHSEHILKLLYPCLTTMSIRMPLSPCSRLFPPCQPPPAPPARLSRAFSKMILSPGLLALDGERHR